MAIVQNHELGKPLLFVPHLSRRKSQKDLANAVKACYNKNIYGQKPPSGVLLHHHTRRFNMANNQAAAPTADFKKLTLGWLSRNRYYILGFFIPVILMYIAYAIFGLHPFGKESVLALDLNAQYVYYFEALRDAFWGDGSPFYSWSRNLSGGFMGIIGYYLASPYTLIVMLLPRKMILTSLLIMILAKMGSASVTFSYYLQKSKKIPPMQAMLFGILFSMCAYMVIQTVDPMWLDGLVMLPLIVLGIEYLVDDGRKLNLIIPTAIMFVANFYIGYMIGIFTVIYFVYYLIFGKEERRGKWRVYAYTCANYVLSMIVTVMLSAFMILPVYNALSLGKFDFSGTPDYSFKTQFLPVDILAQLLTCQYDSVNVQGSPEIYCGIFCVVLLPLFFLNSRISLKQKLGRGALLAAMFFSMYIKPVDMWWHGGQVPNWLPYRYSFIISFILLTMAATALQHLDGVQKKHFGGVFFGILAAVLYIQGRGYEHLGDMRSIWLTIGLAAAYLGFLYYTATKGAGKILPLFMTVLMCGELVLNAVSTLHSIDKEVIYSTKESYESFMINGRKAVDLLESHDDGLYRSEKTFTRCINDNLAWGLKGLTHSSSVMNAKTLSFIETLGYNSRSYYSRYEGTTELADSLLGIKYVIDRDDAPQQAELAANSGSEVEKINQRRRWLLHDTYPEVDRYTYTEYDKTEKKDKEHTFTIHENPNALPIAYLVDEDLLRVDHLGNDNPFNSQNVLLSTMVGDTQFDAENHFTYYNSYYRRIDTGEPVLGAVTVGDYNGQACYTKMDSGDPTVDYRFTVDSEEEILCFLKTENEQTVNLWLGVYDDETDTYKFGAVGYGQYFKTHNYSIISLGRFTPGTQVSLRLTVLDEDGATIIKEPFFYYFDRAAYQTDIDRLKAGSAEVLKHTPTSIKCQVTAQEGQILFTSIPYEPGWTVRVDGKKVESKECLKAMLYVPLAAGTHTVTLSYTTPGLIPGLCLFVLGIGLLALFYWYDRQHNEVLKKKIRERRKAA